MTTQTHYFATRTLARANVEVLNGKLKDFGSTAPKGERWAVLVEVQDVKHSEIEMHQSMDTAIDSTIGLLKRHSLINDASIIAKQRPGIIGEQNLKTQKNKPVRVSWRRSMTALRLANHLAKVS